MKTYVDPVLILCKVHMLKDDKNDGGMEVERDLPGVAQQ